MFLDYGQFVLLLSDSRAKRTSKRARKSPTAWKRDPHYYVSKKCEINFNISYIIHVFTNQSVHVSISNRSPGLPLAEHFNSPNRSLDDITVSGLKQCTSKIIVSFIFLTIQCPILPFVFKVVKGKRKAEFSPFCFEK